MNVTECNKFGCNCENGCIPGDPIESFKACWTWKVEDVSGRYMTPAETFRQIV